MKKAIALFTLFVTALVMAQEKSLILVESSSAVTGVVIVEAVVAGKDVELQCNQGIPSCKALKAGKYVLVELPRNRGMYDCTDVEVYSESSSPEEGKLLGEYCLIRK